MPLVDAAVLSAQVTPVIRYFYPLPESLPPGAATVENVSLDESLIFTVAGVPLDVFFNSADVTRRLLEKVQEVLAQRVEGRWGLQVTFRDIDGELPHPRKLGLQATPILQTFRVEDIENVVGATMYCVDLQFGHCQCDAYLIRLQTAESSMDGRLGFAELVDYEISKSFNQAERASLISEIVEIHHRQAMANIGTEQFDSMLAGYQAAASIKEPDEFSDATLAMASDLRALALNHEQEINKLINKKKSVLRFHLLTVEEGIAELHAFVSQKYISDGNLFHHSLALVPSYKEDFIKRYYSTPVNDSDPYSRGLTLFREIFERHGYTFCHLAAWLCKMNYRKMGNLVPLSALKEATDDRFPFRPLGLLKRLSTFEFEHVNACAKLAPAIAYLGLDTMSAEAAALRLLKRISPQ